MIMRSRKAENEEILIFLGLLAIKAAVSSNSDFDCEIAVECSS